MRTLLAIALVVSLAILLANAQNPKKGLNKSNANTRVKLVKPGQTLKKSPVNNGPDGRPLLFAPKIELCQNRKFKISLLNTTERTTTI